jgi:hypothetical protein
MWVNHRRRSARVHLVAALAVITLGASACGTPAAAPSAAESTATSLAAAPATTADPAAPSALTTPDAPVVPEALRFSAPLVGGGVFDGASMVGRPVAFWFWAPT